MFRVGVRLLLEKEQLGGGPRKSGVRKVCTYSSYVWNTYFCVLGTQNFLMFPRSPSVPVPLNQIEHLKICHRDYGCIYIVNWRNITVTDSNLTEM